jgi:ribosomal protein L29
MTTGSMQLFQLLRARLGEREAEAVVNYVDNTLKENNKDMQDANLRTLATKEDLANQRGLLKEDLANLRGELKTDISELRGELKTDISELRGELKTDISELRGELKTDISELKGELKTNIAEVKSDVIRWTFAFFVTLMLAILGLYLKK